MRSLRNPTPTPTASYQATFDDSEVQHRGKTQPDLQARVFAGDSFLGVSDVHYNASRTRDVECVTG